MSIASIRTCRLLGATVAVIGCGSVGAPVACALAQAGVGRLILVNSETLTWPNVGRHPLGATTVGRNKAEALAERLRADFPHLKVEHRACGLHQLIVHDEDQLAAADMIVAATGSWVAESALNRWHVRQGRRQPIVYGWTEAHACAGHAVAIGQNGGCLQCHIGRTGVPELTAVEWPNDSDIAHEEPACGPHYQPYGPVELAYVNAMIAEVALDCLRNSGGFSLPVILCFYNGSMPQYSTPMLRDPSPGQGSPFDERFPYVLADAVMQNEAVHDGAIMLGRSGSTGVYRVTGWSHRLHPPAISIAVPNKGSAFSSCTAMSCVPGVDALFLISRNGMFVFANGAANMIDA